VKVTVGPPGVDAVRVFAPGVVPSVHEPTRAVPVESVLAVAPVTDPPPLATAKVTTTAAVRCELVVAVIAGAVATA
jgi:hypothetical protein